MAANLRSETGVNDRYTSPAGFKQGLETRLRRHARDLGLSDPNRLRRRLLLDRYCARVFATLGDDVVLKGGMVVELRVGRARMTRDMDLRVVGQPDALLSRLQAAGRRDLDDFLRFDVVPDPRHPTIEAEGMRYEGRRFRVTTFLAGRPYGGPFGVDVAFAEPMTGTTELLDGLDLLAFAGVERPRFAVYPLETHIAEKLHAYTVPRSRPNSRVKDLPDIALLAGVRSIESRVLRSALEGTWGHRDTHRLPMRLPEPPPGWEPVYKKIADDDRLPWASLDEVLDAARRFLNPILAGARGVWEPAESRWR
jgi:hypothetical protein